MARKAPTKRTKSISPPPSPALSSPLSSPEPPTVDRKPKVEHDSDEHQPAKPSAAALKKIQLYEKQLQTGTPFPQWAHPTRSEAQLVADRLASVHGMPQRPKVLVDKPGAAAGCGQTPDVLDALIRTILSQNTTSKNSTRAKLSMDEVYGRAEYRKVLEGGEVKLEDAIRCGGLAKQKSKSIIGVLRRIDDKLRNEGRSGEQLSLDWLHSKSDEEAMKELISYDLVGIKTASCVLLFCLGRSSFAVDTHVHRLTQSLGWLPPTGSVYTVSPDSDDLKNPQFSTASKTTTAPSRDQTFYHLDATLPDELKYPLHSLLVRHGRGCVKCAANGVTTQDIVDTCPIEDLIVRGKNGKKRSPKKIKVENEDGDKVGQVEEDDDGNIKLEVKDEVKAEIGEHNEAGQGDVKVKVEDEVLQTRRTPKRSAKKGGSHAEVEEEDDDDDKKPAKRPRTKRTSSSSADLGKSMSKTKKGVAVTGKNDNMVHSVDRDEAEMSGRGWHQGTMHGLEV